MRHPFDGIIIPSSEGNDGANGGDRPAEQTVSRRDWLQQLLAASAGMLALPLTGSAVPPPPLPPDQKPGPTPTTLALGEEGNPPRTTTKALDEEGNPPPKPKDPGQPTTLALGEEGNPPPKPKDPGQPTTLALGEEGNPPAPRKG